MDSKADIIDSVRKLAISRRGGVRTRGGRLPPINMREITHVTCKKETKKMIAPNIPQRRRIKQEVEVKAEPVQTFERKAFQAERGRGRGRQSKVLLQTEGSFLAEGPAARVKKDPLGYESFSIPRYSKSSAASEACGHKYDDETLKQLLEEPYDEFGAYVDDDCLKPPYRLPLLKSKRTKKPVTKVIIKTEPEEDGIKEETVKEETIKEETVKEETMKIKKEGESDSGEVIKTEKEIKTESVDDEDDFIGRRKIKIKKEVISDSEDDDDPPKSEKDGPKKEVEEIDDSVTEDKSTADFIQSVDGKGKIILLQIPSHTILPEAGNSDGSSKDKSKKVEDKPEEGSTFLDSLQEGYIGRLQIMKSGKMKLKLGPVEFELLDGSPSESYWEAVSIQMREDAGDMAVLGKVEKKLILTPVLDMLLKEEQPAESKKS